mmetsp:Transcript_18881/g.36498  ORF Transcript_18881/g.36498 Transcript_18881/m.36498 type:complete len:278 (+) Transcript_18881:251-1084(+)
MNALGPSCAEKASRSLNPGFPGKSRRLSTATNSPSRNENGGLVRSTAASVVSSVSMLSLVPPSPSFSAPSPLVFVPRSISVSVCDSAVFATVGCFFSAVGSRRCLRSGVRMCQRCPWKYHFKRTRSFAGMPLTSEHRVRKSRRLGGEPLDISATVGFIFFKTLMNSCSILFGILERSRFCTSLVLLCSIPTSNHTFFFFSSSISTGGTPTPSPSHMCIVGGIGPNTPYGGTLEDSKANFSFLRACSSGLDVLVSLGGVVPFFVARFSRICASASKAK